MNLGFSKSSRLLSPKDFSPVFKSPQFRVSSPYFLMLALENKQSSSRLGIVVAKKNIRTAVQRNRIKRILRESFRIKKSEFATIDIVVLVKKGLDSLENKEIQTQICILFEELKRKQGQSSY